MRYSIYCLDDRNVKQSLPGGLWSATLHPKQKFTRLRLPGHATSWLGPGPFASLTFKTNSQGCNHVAVTGRGVSVCPLFRSHRQRQRICGNVIGQVNGNPAKTLIQYQPDHIVVGYFTLYFTCFREITGTGRHSRNQIGFHKIALPTCVDFNIDAPKISYP